MGSSLLPSSQLLSSLAASFIGYFQGSLPFRSRWTCFAWTPFISFRRRSAQASTTCRTVHFTSRSAHIKCVKISRVHFGRPPFTQFPLPGVFRLHVGSAPVVIPTFLWAFDEPQIRALSRDLPHIYNRTTRDFFYLANLYPAFVMKRYASTSLSAPPFWPQSLGTFSVRTFFEVSL